MGAHAYLADGITDSNLGCFGTSGLVSASSSLESLRLSAFNFAIRSAVREFDRMSSISLALLRCLRAFSQRKKHNYKYMVEIHVVAGYHPQ